MGKHKQVLAVTEAAKAAGKQLAAWNAVEVSAQKAVEESAQKVNLDNFANFFLSGTGSKAIVRIGESLFRIEG